MKIEDLVLLTDGLSVPAGTAVMMCDRARIAPVRDHAIDLSFLIAGTDFVPRLRLTRDRIAKATTEEIAGIIRRVARRAVGGQSSMPR
jgi:hypothetical protein